MASLILWPLRWISSPTNLCGQSSWSNKPILSDSNWQFMPFISSLALTTFRPSQSCCWSFVGFPPQQSLQTKFLVGESQHHCLFLELNWQFMPFIWSLALTTCGHLKSFFIALSWIHAPIISAEKSPGQRIPASLSIHWINLTIHAIHITCSDIFLKLFKIFSCPALDFCLNKFFVKWIPTLNRQISDASIPTHHPFPGHCHPLPRPSPILSPSPYPRHPLHIRSQNQAFSSIRSKCYKRVAIWVDYRWYEKTDRLIHHIWDKARWRDGWPNMPHECQRYVRIHQTIC